MMFVSVQISIFSSDANQKIASSAARNKVEPLPCAEEHGMGMCGKLSTCGLVTKESYLASSGHNKKSLEKVLK